jgi:hypothetical protein
LKPAGPGGEPFGFAIPGNAIAATVPYSSRPPPFTSRKSKRLLVPHLRTKLNIYGTAKPVAHRANKLFHCANSFASRRFHYCCERKISNGGFSGMGLPVIVRCQTQLKEGRIRDKIRDGKARVGRPWPAVDAMPAFSEHITPRSLS